MVCPQYHFLAIAGQGSTALQDQLTGTGCITGKETTKCVQTKGTLEEKERMPCSRVMPETVLPYV